MNTTKIVTSAFVLIFALNFASASGQNVLQKIQNEPQLSAFAAALTNAGLKAKLTSGGPFTVFAPSNNAFNSLAPNKKSKKGLLLNHIITGNATKRSLKYMDHIISLSGNSIDIKKNNSTLTVQNHSLVKSNIDADNGVIHIIDGVINN